jgi:hypothetical protein
MRTFAIVLLFLIVVPATAQSSAPSITLGEFPTVRLTLGTPKDAVMQVLKESFALSDLATGGVAVDSATNKLRGFGSVSFKNGKLSSVVKFWTIDEPDSGVAISRAIHGAISSFGDAGSSCSVETFDDNEPTVQKKGIMLHCGQKHLEVFTNHWSFGDKSGEGAVVTEVLGER